MDQHQNSIVENIDSNSLQPNLRSRASFLAGIKLWQWLLVGATVAILMIVVRSLPKTLATPPPHFPALETPNYQALVSVTWVKALQDFHESNFQTPCPLTYHNRHYVILEASWAALSDAKDYQRGHIPGAFHFNTDEMEDGYPTWKLRPAAELQQLAGRYGITSETTVVVYGSELIAAARVWWVLKYAGVADVRLLDGGSEMWDAVGYPLEMTIQSPLPVTFTAPVSSDLLATTDHIRKHLEDQQIWLADARSEAEFSGRWSGYNYLDCKGRIPSSISIGSADDSSGLYTQGGRFGNPREIEALWRQLGIVSVGNEPRFDREVVFYCGGGWRSSLAFFYAWLLGYENIRNYSDGWCGWSTVYVPDTMATGNTPGWSQQRTNNPTVMGNE